MGLIKTETINHGLVCHSCQENVNIRGCCAKCGEIFYEGETIYCKHHTIVDCEHYHENCRPKEKKGTE